MKKLLSLVAAMIIAATVFGQEVTEATITTIGTGVDEEKATLQALRSAIEQTFGTFVSANTTILNDKMVQDEIVSVSNGNVKQYKKIAVATLPNKQVSVTVTATISINKLITYAQSKGSRAEFAGQTFATNLRLMQLRAQSSKKAMKQMCQQLDKIADQMFDFKMQLGDPNKIGNNYYFQPIIEVYSNVASTNFFNLLVNTLKELKLSDEDARFCKNAGIPISYFDGPIVQFWGDKNDAREGYGGEYAKKIGLSPCQLPFSSEECCAFNRSIEKSMTKAYLRFTINEINNPSNKYLCKNELPYRAEEKKFAIRIPSFKSIGNRGEKYLYSTKEKSYIKLLLSTKDRTRTTLKDLFQLGSSFCLTEVRTPIKLTKQQQKEVKKGIYNGPTYTVTYKNPQLLACFVSEVSIPADAMEQGRFQGFEIVTK